MTTESEHTESPNDGESTAAIPTAASTTTVDADLPQEEELTPEILEDECRRGDAMLRWAALLLAVLLSWTYITDSAVFVKVRSGEYMASHGVLPPRVDPLSASAQGRTWVNLGWLSDLSLALGNKAGNWGITLVGVACAFCGFYALSQISIPNVTTWWASICLVLAAIAVFPVLQPGQGSVTVLGLGMLLWVLHDARLRPSAGLTWKVALIMALWSNADPHAFLGLALLIGWAAGNVLQGATSPEPNSSQRSVERPQPWPILGAGLLGSIVHPWHYHVLLAPYVKLFVTAPETRLYAETSDMGLNWLIYGPAQAPFWKQLDPFSSVGLVLFGFAVFSLLLNRRGLDYGLTLGWVLINLLGLMSGDLFACAAAVNAVVATLNGQGWFRERFSQEYTIDRWNVLRSQAGRAVTVLAMFAVAYVTINGVLMGPGGRRIGMGLDPRWRDRIQGIEQLTSQMYKERVFPLRLDQGDLLVWVGKQPFVDSRLGLYATHGENLLAKHRSVRAAIRVERPQMLGSGQPDVWKSVLAEYETYNVMPRLWGTPDYGSFADLAQNQWSLTGLSGAGAVFVSRELDPENTTLFVAEHTATDFLKDGLREPEPSTIVKLQATWPTPPNVYDKWFIQRIPRVNDGTQMALHYNNLRADQMRELEVLLSMASNPQAPNLEQIVLAATEAFPRTFSLSLLSIRHARRGLDESAQQGGRAGDQVEAYRVLRETYLDFGRLEQIMGERFGGIQLPTDFRTMQALAAAHDAYRASGAAEDLFPLAKIQIQLQQFDLALRSLETYQQLTGQLTPLPLTDAAGVEEQATIEQALDQIRERVTSVRDALDLQLNEAPDPARLFQIAMGGQCPGVALEVLERDKTVLAENLDLNLMYAQLLLQSGRTEEAWEALESMDRRFPDERVPPQDMERFKGWCQQATTANLAALDLNRADELLTRSVKAQERFIAFSLLASPPLAFAPPGQLELAGPISTKMVTDVMFQHSMQWDQTKFDIARVRWERGDVPGAQQSLEQLLEEHPNTPLRPLVAWMLTAMTGRPTDPNSPSDQIPITEDLFAPEEAHTEAESLPAAPEE